MASHNGSGVNRAEFLAALIGGAWNWRSYNCWQFACHVQKALFGRELPHVDVPADLSKRWLLNELTWHPERTRWRAVPDGPAYLVLAQDGALVLMAHSKYPAHVGVWLKPEGRVIHCDTGNGVACETPLALRQSGWLKMTFFEPKEE